MNIKGKLEAIMPTVQVSEKFRKREFVVEYAENPQYPELIKLEFIQDKCELLDGFKVGQTVDVLFNLKGRKWQKNGETSYFNTLQAWKIISGDGVPAKDPRTEPRQESKDAPVCNDETDDLPF